MAMHQPTADICAVILASGFARRMGQQKLLLPLASGEAMIRRIVQTALDSEARRVFVVVPEEHAAFVAACSGLAVTWCVNAEADTGMSAAVRTAAQVLLDTHCSAAVFLLGDMPDVRTDVVNQVIASYTQSKAPIVQVSYRGVFRHPVLFARALFPELRQVAGDQGGREVVARHRAACAVVAVDTEAPPDIDTPEDYARLLR